LEAEKNPGGRTGIVGIGSLPNFGPNQANCIFIISQNHFVVSNTDHYDIPMEFLPPSDVNSTIKKLGPQGVSLRNVYREVPLDSEFNTGWVKKISKLI